MMFIVFVIGASKLFHSFDNDGWEYYKRTKYLYKWYTVHPPEAKTLHITFRLYLFTSLSVK